MSRCDDITASRVTGVWSALYTLRRHQQRISWRNVSVVVVRGPRARRGDLPRHRAPQQKLARTLSLEAELSFYRSRSGLEVDLLVDTPRGVLAFEIKARETSSPTDFRPLRLLAERLGNGLLASSVVTSGRALARGPSDGSS